MNLSNNTIERICRVFGYLDALERKGVELVSSKELAQAIGTTEYTVRKDISLLDVTGYTRKGYLVESLKEKVGKKLSLNQNRRAGIIGLGRLGTALLDYKKFQEDGFEIVAGFDASINKLERIRTNIDVFPVDQVGVVVAQRNIDLGIIAVPAQEAQDIADQLVQAEIKGILNFSTTTIIVPKHIIHLDLDFTSALRFIAARLTQESDNKGKEVSHG